MFVGIVEGIGKVVEIKSQNKSLDIEIEYPAVKHLKIGDSISVNGACLTVVEFDQHSFKVNVVQETLDKTNLAQLSVGDKINIENAAKIGDSIGGHLVQGHVDTIGIVEAIWNDGAAKWLRITFEPQWQVLLVNKGFITVDGVSLTVVEANEQHFTVTLIPHTQQQTIVQYYTVGSVVNLEFDIVAKQIQKYMEHYDARKI